MTLQADNACEVFFLKRFITQTIYKKCTRINYTVVPLNNFNIYMYFMEQVDMSNMYRNISIKNGSEK